MVSRPHLVFFRQGEQVLEYRLSPGQTTLGRADSCDISLPGDEISRSHCLIQGHGQQWTVVDRSRHGTTVNGERTRRAELSDGDRIGVGMFEIVFRAHTREVTSTADALPARLHEQLLRSSEDGLVIQVAALEVVEGEGLGATHPLRQARVTVGGDGSGIALGDPMLVADHCRLRVSRGRVMLEPGRGAVWLDGSRLRQITPLYPGEVFRIGETTLRLVLQEARPDQEAGRFGEMRGESPAMRRLFGRMRMLAGHDDPVLIIGDSGTGKELAARALHEHSPRAAGPFIPLNCGGLAPQVLHSELFGYEKGSFTGAEDRRDGAFHKAHGGTLFLDELGELSMDAQASLLRALGGGGIRRVGGFVLEYPDVRVIAATNRDLRGMVRNGEFRTDLFFRLETLFIQLPSLRDRPDDIRALAEHYASQQDPRAFISPDAMAVLLRHSWPGNVRELFNVIRRATLEGGVHIGAKDLYFHKLSLDQATSHRSDVDESSRPFLETLLARHGGNRSQAARELGLSRSTLLYRLKKVGLG